MNTENKKSKLDKKWIILMIVGIIGIAAGVYVYIHKQIIRDYIFEKTTKIEDITSNVSDDMLSPLGYATVIDSTNKAGFILRNAGLAKSITFGGKTIELAQFAQRDTITVVEIASYLENLSTVSDLDGYTEVDTVNNISASKFEEIINEYIENTMKAEENILSFRFINGDEIDITTTDPEHSDSSDEIARVKPNTLEVKIYFAPRIKKGDETWTKENIFISYVELHLSNKGQGQATPYGINGEKIIDTYINFEGNKSVAVWKKNFVYAA